MIEYTAEDIAFRDAQRAKLKRPANAGIKRGASTTDFGEPITVDKPYIEPMPLRKGRQKKEKPPKVPRPRKCSDARAYDQKLGKHYRSYIMRANAKQIPFEFTEEAFNEITSMPCTYCGTESRIGIDRRDSNGGYTLDNCYPCCTTCNMMKHRNTHSDFLRQVKRIVSHLGL